MPEKWFEEEYVERRAACGVPEDLGFKTKPEIGLELLKNAVNCNHQIKGEQYELHKPDALGKFIGRQSRER